MTFLIIFAIIASLVMILLAAKMNSGNRQAQWQADLHKNDKDHTPIKARAILTVNELPMFLKLRKALPDHIILTQVALSALLSSTGEVTRNRFTRYRADFVVLDKDAHVVAIIELNDRSHKVQTSKVDECVAMLNEANYRIIRYTHTPDIEQIQRDISMPKPVKKFSKNKPLDTEIRLKNAQNKSFFEQDY